MTAITAQPNMGRARFIETNELWDAEDRQAADAVSERVETDGINLVRMAFTDQHGIVRAKAMTRQAFLAALESGADMNTGPLFFDTANAIVFNPFIDGGGFGIPEMTGCPNLIMVPDPKTFRVLPWVERAGLVLCDLYFNTGQPCPYSSRGVLTRVLGEAHREGFEYLAGLEVEWYLTRLVDARLEPADLGAPGQPGPGPVIQGVSTGFSYQLEYHLDEISAFLADFVEALESLGLPLRTIEDEWGPSQIETTFAPMRGVEGADAMVLFRTATKQLARRHGLHATFMCRPAFPTFYSSGWHLHQSLLDRSSGANAFAPADDKTGGLSPVGQHFLGGLLEHARPAAVFTTPTVNGYKRLKPNSLAPDRVAWGIDNRGSMCRVIAAPDDPTSRIENRVGEPAANPYLYLASQIAAGVDGIRSKLDPGSPTVEPYGIDAPPLPTSLREAIDHLKGDPFFRESFGAQFVDYIVAMRESEWSRYEAAVAEHPPAQEGDVTDWEQREYFNLL